jgi:hypothetical protein
MCVDKDGIITAPGKFEGEPEFVLYYWEQALEGGADEVIHGDNEVTYVFTLGKDDFGDHPSLAKLSKRMDVNEGDLLLIWEDDHGFVHHEFDDGGAATKLWFLQTRG